MNCPHCEMRIVHTRLSIDLNDHLGAATGGVDLARRLSCHNKRHGVRPRLEDIAQQIEEDVASLRDVMARLGVEPGSGQAGGGAGRSRRSAA